MMESMIKKLLEEAAEAAAHKKWCDSEIAKTKKQHKFHKSNQVKFKSRIEEKTAELEKIKEKIAAVTQSLADMIKAAQEMTKQRQKEAKEAQEAIREYADAQAAVQKATQVISDFYAKQNRK